MLKRIKCEFYCMRAARALKKMKNLERKMENKRSKWHKTMDSYSAIVASYSEKLKKELE